MVANICQLPLSSGTTTLEGVDILFGNEAAIEAYSVFKMSVKLAEKGLYLKSLARLDCWMDSYLEDLARKKNRVYHRGHVTVVFRNTDLELLPVDM